MASGGPQYGYESDRFVVDDNTLMEFLCGICQGVFREPKVTKCCQQIYCQTEIVQWLTTSGNCPNCRTPLNARHLSDPSKALKNLWLKLKIKCNYSEEGCDQSIPLEQLTAHMDQCLFKPNTICQTCDVFRESARSHNCIANLKNKIIEDKKVFDLTLKKIKEEMRSDFRDHIERLQIELIFQNEANTKIINKKFNQFKTCLQINEQVAPCTSQKTQCTAVVPKREPSDPIIDEDDFDSDEEYMSEPE